MFRKKIFHLIFLILLFVFFFLAFFKQFNSLQLKNAVNENFDFYLDYPEENEEYDNGIFFLKIF